jgi:hypothetical protein
MSQSDPRHDDRSIPLSALVLGAGGAIPFIVLAAALALNLAPFGLPERVLHQALLTYAALIASFLGGVRWGIGLNAVTPRRAATLFCVAVLPALTAWFALMLPRAIALPTIAGVFLVLVVIDIRLVIAGEAPRWYGTLRIGLTTAVLASLIIAMVAPLV